MTVYRPTHRESTAKPLVSFGFHWAGKNLRSEEAIIMANELYFEDFHLGQKFTSDGSVKVSAKEITEFAA